MSLLKFTKTSAPATPAANKSTIYVDTTTRRLSQIDDNGVISVMSNIGPMDENIITNGGFNIQQRVATASTAIASVSTTTRAGVVADRWAVTTSATGATISWAQIDTSASPETGLTSRYYGSVIVATTGRKVMLSQWIINAEMMHLLGKKVRVSLKHNQKVGSGQLYHLGLLYLNSSGTVDVSPAFLTGAWSTSTGVDPAWATTLIPIAPDASPTGENGTVSGNWLNVTSVAATWTRSSAVFSVPATAKNLAVVFFSDATGGTSDNISIAEFQMTEGSDIVDYVEPPLAYTLIRCQRFFCKSFPQTVVPAASVAVATGGYGATFILGKTGSGTLLGSQIPIQFPVVMWKAPTVTLYTPTTTGAVVFRHTGTSPLSQGTTTVAANSTTDRGCHVTATNEATTNGAIGDLVSVHYSADSEIIN